MTSLTRRRLLARMAAGGAGASILPGLFTPIQQAFAIEPTPGSQWSDADHIVFLMQENRSFDHVYGSLSGVRGFNDPRALTLPSGLPVWCQAMQDGRVFTPFRLNLQHSKFTWMGCLPHNWPDQVDARNGGHHDRWLPNKVTRNGLPLTLGFHTREDLPFYYSLADAFTVCDQYYCSTLTGTTSNRIHFWAGTNRVRQDQNAPPLVYNGDYENGIKIRIPTIPERLTKAGVSWRVYQNELYLKTGLSRQEEEWVGNFGDNPLEYLEQYNVKFSKSHYQHLQARLTAVEARLAALSDEKSKNELHAQQRKLKQDLARWAPERFAALDPQSQAIHRQAFTTNDSEQHYRQIQEVALTGPNGSKLVGHVPKGDVLARFRADVEAGTLPTVSWLVAPMAFSDHPDSPWFGAWYVSEVLAILARNPERWRKTIFILNYDENDGFFDHAPCYVAPDPTDPTSGSCSPSIDPSLERTTRDRKHALGLGYRVPMVIASPWTRGGYVHSELCDHTSPLRFLEHYLQKRFNIAIHEDQISSWRRGVLGDLTSAFRPGSDEPAPMPAFLDQQAWVQTILSARQQPIPDPGQALTAADTNAIRAYPQQHDRLPRQEPGTRPATPLPYDLIADGNLQARTFQFDFAARSTTFGAASRGAPFQVHAAFATTLAASDWRDHAVRDYAVAAGETLSSTWNLPVTGAYRFFIHAPNGFYRHFQGDEHDPALHLHLETVINDGGNQQEKSPAILLVLRNDGAKIVSVNIRDQSYGAAPRTVEIRPAQSERLHFSLASSHGWYDLAITTDATPGFFNQFAGHCETGLPSRTDPKMGGKA